MRGEGSDMANRHDVEQRARTMDALVHQLESEADPGVRATARALVQALLEFHSDGLTRLLEIVDATGAPGAALIDRLGGDELVRPLLLLHGLHPLDLRTRVLEALEQTRPFLRTHSGAVECIDVDDSGVVTLRLETHGCGSSDGALKSAIEDALREAAPDLSRLVFESASDPVGAVAFVPIDELRRTAVAVERNVG
jgi:Fe-S cluster biogenesis protein NfuA